jgi:hypothetical protein
MEKFMANDLNMALSANFSLFGTEISSMYLKEGDGYRVLVIPNLAEDAPMISIAELAKDIVKLAGSKDADGKQAEELEKDITAKIGNDKGIDVKFQLKMLYLYIDTTAGEDKKVLEYAININIDASELIPAELSKLVTVERIGIAVWSTERKAILDNMSIVDINSYLGLPG